jgi:hypothetical protein
MSQPLDWSYVLSHFEIWFAAEEKFKNFRWSQFEKHLFEKKVI